MSKPNFTSEELYLINGIKAKDTGASSFYMWHYLIGGFVMAMLGIAQDNGLLILCALALVAGYRIYEERHYRKYIPAWRSIIDKYETAIDSTNTELAARNECERTPVEQPR